MNIPVKITQQTLHVPWRLVWFLTDLDFRLRRSRRAPTLAKQRQFDTLVRRLAKLNAARGDRPDEPSDAREFIQSRGEALYEDWKSENRRR